MKRAEHTEHTEHVASRLRALREALWLKHAEFCGAINRTRQTWRRSRPATGWMRSPSPFASPTFGASRSTGILADFLMRRRAQGRNLDSAPGRNQAFCKHWRG